MTTHLPQKNKFNRGFIKNTLIIVGLLVLLKYTFDIDIVKLLTEGKFREIYDKAYSMSSHAWVKYRDLIIRLWHISREVIEKYGKIILEKVGNKIK